MEGRTLLQYLIDISDITVAKKQEATEYLARLEAAAQQSVHPTNDGHTKSDSEFTPDPVSSDLDDDREDTNPLFYGSR